MTETQIELLLPLLPALVFGCMAAWACTWSGKFENLVATIVGFIAVFVFEGAAFLWCRAVYRFILFML